MHLWVTFDSVEWKIISPSVQMAKRNRNKCFTVTLLMFHVHIIKSHMSPFCPSLLCLESKNSFTFLMHIPPRHVFLRECTANLERGLGTLPHSSLLFLSQVLVTQCLSDCLEQPSEVWHQMSVSAVCMGGGGGSQPGPHGPQSHQVSRFVGLENRTLPSYSAMNCFVFVWHKQQYCSVQRAQDCVIAL